MRTREQVDLELIDDNPWQPRQAIDPDALDDLAESIHQLGLLQSPLGRRSPDVSDRIQTAFGHRRVAACRLLYQQGRWERYIEMDVADLTDEEMAVMALTENESRKQLSQIEVVRAHKRAIDETSLSVQALADKLAMNRPTLANNLRILELPDFILEHVESGDLRITVARDFLMLQNADHAHTEDMQAIVEGIVNPYYARQGLPDWRRSNVRRAISERVAYNETDYRPLGPRTGHGTAGAAREATFDVDAFATERPDALHTIPGGDGPDEKHEGSRLWTCAVKDWTRAQTRATREANQEAVESGRARPAAPSKKAVSRDKQFEQLLARDPVWKQITVSRETPGPNRPTTDEEREQLGTRSEFQDLGSYGNGFWKILEKADPRSPQEWERKSGGGVPPWFPDLKECQECTIGATYAKSRGGYPLRDPTLVCINQDHYLEKVRVGEAAYREKKAAQRTGFDRQDSKAVERFIRELVPLSDDACRALAVSLLAARPALEWQHPLGIFHEEWSYEAAPAARVRELTSGKSVGNGSQWNQRKTVIDLDSLQSVTSGELRELLAALMTHHLRLAGELETVPQQTPDTLPANEVHMAQRVSASRDGQRGV